MVAIFTGAGAGFTRGSANLLGGIGQLGGGLLGWGSENVSVNAATGNLVVSHQDEFLIGRGPDVGISRTYNSLGDASDGDNGDSWQQSTTRRVFGLTGSVNTAGSTISRLGGDGSVIVYTWNASRSAYVTTDGAGAHDELRHAAGVWTWTDGDSRATETYQAYSTDNWRITAAADSDGNALSYTYAGALLDKVTTADGGWTQYVWSGSNITQVVTGYTDLATSTAKTLTRTRYAYDASNRLTLVTTDLTPGDSSVADGQTYTISYTYDGTSNRIATIGQADGSLLTIGYDASGRVQTLTQQVASGNSRVTTLTYGAGYTSVTGPDGKVTRLDYDSANRLTTITAPAAYSGAAAQTVQFAYDADGNLASATDPRGEVTSYLYDTNGNVTQVTDANGNVVQRTYDAANRLITELAYGSDATGASAAHYAQYAYDSEGHLRYAVNGAGQVTEYEYTAAGDLARKIDYPEHVYAVGPAAISEAGMNAWIAGQTTLVSAKVVEYAYDARSNRTSMTAYSEADASGAGVAASGISQAFYTYDQAGNLLAQYNAGETSETFVYDGMGRLVASTDVHGSTTTIVFNNATLTTTVGTATNQYDKNGRLRIATDASGRTSYFVYDFAGRRVADVNHLGELVEYRYDQANRVVATIRHANVLSGAQLAVLANPDNGAELSSLLPAASTADMWSWTVYDDGGRVLQTIAGDGSVAAFEYDQSDRLVRTTSYFTRLTSAQLDGFRVTLPTASVLPTANARDAFTRQFYNAAGQLIGVLDGEGFLTETVYDAAGQAIEQIAYANPTTLATRATASFATLRGQLVETSTVDRVSHQVYDGQGHLRFTVNALGGVSALSYDSAGRVTTRTEYAAQLTLGDFTYDAVKAAVTTSATDRKNYTVYDAAGRAAYTIDAEGGVAAFTYDSSGRLVKSVLFSDLNVVSSLPTLAAMNSWASDPTHASDSTNRVTRNWYNARGELVYTVDAGTYVRGYTYDAEGRALSESAWPNTVVVGDTTTLAQVAALAAGAGTPITISRTYDNAGRLLTSTDGEGIVTRHVYNALGQLTDTYLADNVAADTARLHYEYDSTGRLVAEYQAYGTGTQVVSTYSYDGLGNRVSATDANGNTTTFSHDELGRVLTSTNALGGITTWKYDAFGNVLAVTDPVGNTSYSYYDRLDRLVATRDGEGYVTRTLYNRFGEAVTVERYSVAMTTPGEAGIAVFDPALVPVDPYALADQLQAAATAKDTLADTAEAAVGPAQQNATTRAQEAAVADDKVDDLEAELAALGNATINYTAERNAALADPAAWLATYGDELLQKRNEVNTLIQGTNGGDFREQLQAYKDFLNNLENYVGNIQNDADSNPADTNVVAYINGHYDYLTWRSNHGLGDRTTALSGSLAWLGSREADLVQQITFYSSLASSGRLPSALTNLKTLFAEVIKAKYDVQNNVYSGNWQNNVSTFYSTYLSNPQSLYTNLNTSTQQTSSYRSSNAINAYFDVATAIGMPPTAQEIKQAELNQANIEATAAHGLANDAQLAATAAAAAAVALRADATQAQLDADAAYAAALASSGTPLLDNYVVLPLASLGSPSRTDFGYDRLGRTVWKVDAESYFEHYEYNAFGQQVAMARYEVPVANRQPMDLSGGLPPEVVAAYANADTLQGTANIREAEAQVADDAVNAVETQIIASLGIAIDYSSARSAALAGPIAWLNTQTTQLTNQRDAVRQGLVSGSSGDLRTEYQRYDRYLSDLSSYVDNLSKKGPTNSDVTSYINGYYDYLTWYSTHSLQIRGVATDDPAAWLALREENINHLIAFYSGISGNTDNILSTLKFLQYEVVKAKYDLQNGSYSAGWSNYSNNAISQFYTQYLAGSSSIYNGVALSSLNSTDYRAGLIVQAYFDVEDATGTSPVSPQLQTDLTNAKNAAAAAHTLANAAQVTADNELASARALEDAMTPDNARTEFTYDNRGLLTKVTDAERYFESFTYDAWGRRASHTAKSYTALLTAGGLTTYVYDKRGLLLSETLPIISYTSAGAVQASSVTNKYAYDARGNRISMIEADGLTEKRTTLYAYDKLDRLTGTTHDSVGTMTINTSTKAVSSASNVSLTEAITYDLRGNVIRTVDVAGTATVFFYDQLNRKTLEINALGTYTAYEYDANGMVTRIRVFDTAGSVPANGGAAAGAPALPSGSWRETTFTYDRLGRLLTSNVLGVTTGEGSGSSWISTTTAITTTYEYDHLGNVVKLTDPNGSTVWSWYDDLGRKTAQVDGENYLTTYALDSEGNVLRETRYATPVTSAITAGGDPPAINLIPNSNFSQGLTGWSIAHNPNNILKPGSPYIITNVNGTGTNCIKAEFNATAAGQIISLATTSGVPVVAGDYLAIQMGIEGQGWGVIDSQWIGVWFYDANGNVVPNSPFVNSGIPNASHNGPKTYNTKLGGFMEVPQGAVSMRLELYATTAGAGQGTFVITQPMVSSVSRSQTQLPAFSSNAGGVAGLGDARTTIYTYDLNGNRLTESRLNVQVHNGSGGYNTVSATISYLYNGLGQVVRKTEATGDQVNYLYDAGGRLIEEKRASFSGATPEVDYYYNGLGNLMRTVQAAATGTAAAAARVTTYAYGAGGRLTSMTDTGGYVHSYYYDKAGRLVMESYVRTNSAGTSVTEGVGHRYDALGRNLGQAFYVLSGGTWTFQSANDHSTLEYNAHGDVTRINVNGLWQQESKYDAAGRVWATNSGDGVWKYFGYDKNGNQTLAVTSAGYNMTGLASVTAAYNKRNQTDVNATITFYDNRNQATSVREEGRQLGASTVDLVTSRTYNAFGEVASETDANNATITYTYNTMGRVITIQSPQVSITTETGAVQNVTPTENFYYDVSGRLTGQRDANSNLTRYTLLAGSGYGGSQALITLETHADVGTVTTQYNVHGDATKVTNEVGLITTMGYDGLGRLTQVTNPGGLIDTYSYDVLGQRLTHYNSFLTSTNKETTDYDIQGRVTSQRAFGGDITSTSYVWSNTIATGGMVTFGGWTETTTFANTRTLIEKSDLFGRITQRTDLGGNVTNFTYDAAGRLVSSTSTNSDGTSTNAWTYFSTGRMSRTSTTTSYQYWYLGGSYSNESRADYTYDKVGNRLTEQGSTITTGSTTVWKSQTATYDALGRLKTWNEAGTSTSPVASITYAYDAAGNVRRSTATYRQLDGQGAVAASSTTQDYWFRYDNMNRVVLERGVLSGAAGAAGTTIVRSPGFFTSNQGSHEILYDKAGRRTAMLMTKSYLNGFVMNYKEQREIYSYNAAGRLSQVDVTEGTGGASTTPAAAPTSITSATDRAVFTYDAMGRMTRQEDHESGGVNIAYSRDITYNAKGQTSSDTTNTKRGTDIFRSINTYGYGSGTSYALGQMVTISGDNYKNNVDADAKDTLVTNTYAWREGAVQSQITNNTDVSDNNPTYYTYFDYDAAGRLTSASIQDGRPRSVTFRIDENGQIIRRDEADNNTTNGDPHEVWYRFGGRQMGYVGNNGTADTDYATSITSRQATQGTGAFRGGATTASTYADFGQAYDPINSYSQGSAGGSYTVKTGDTLQSIAQAIWGDADLWYKLAEANGLSGNAGLIEGQTLQLPAGVVKNTHNAGTVKPYDPAEAIGDLNPTTPKPPKKGKCGVFGMVLLAVVAIAVTAIVGPEIIPVLKGALGATGAAIAGGAIAGAAGSIASQVVGLATGIQDKFSFKGVALAALGGAVGGGINIGKVAGSAFLGDVATGVLRSTVTQGIAVATGLQSKFDFAGVAAAGIGAGVGSAVTRELKLAPLSGSGRSLGNIAGHTLSGTASAIANAATRSAIEGSSFGDNIMRALPDALGSTLGRALAGGGTGAPQNLLPDKYNEPWIAYDDVGFSDDVTGSGPAALVAANNAQATGSPVAQRNMTAGQRTESGLTAVQPESWAAFPEDFSGSHTATSRLEVDGSITVTANYRPSSEVPYWQFGMGFFSQLEQKIPTVYNSAKFLTMGAVTLYSGGNTSPAYQQEMWASGRRAGNGLQRIASGLANTVGDVLMVANAGYNPTALSDSRQRAMIVAANQRNGARVVGMVRSARDAVETAGAGIAMIHDGLLLDRPQGYAAAGLANTLVGGISIGATVIPAARIGASGSAARISLAAERGAFSGAYATNGELVQSIATRADNWGARGLTGNGPVVGTYKHGYAEAMLNRYQRMFGDRGLTTEARFVNGSEWRVGDPLAGSIRLDVTQGPLTAPTHVWDYKFGGATLSPSRVIQIQNGIPNGANVPVLEIKP